MTRYIKFLSALFGGIATWGYTAAADDLISKMEWFGLFGVLATSLAVFQFPNTPPAGENRDPNVSETDGGHYDPVAMAVFALVLIVALVVILKVLDHA